MHTKLQVLSDLLQPEKYNVKRDTIRPFMLGYKAHRTLQLGPFMRIQFEDALTLNYQVQEILRIEQSQTLDAFCDEWLAYRALHPVPGVITATLMIELNSPSLLKACLWQLNRAASGLYLQSGEEQCRALLNSDLCDADTRQHGVHFVAFKPSAAFLAEVENGQGVQLRCDDVYFGVQADLNKTLCDQLRGEAISRLTRVAKRFP